MKWKLHQILLTITALAVLAATSFPEVAGPVTLVDQWTFDKGHVFNRLVPLRRLHEHRRNHPMDLVLGAHVIAIANAASAVSARSEPGDSNRGSKCNKSTFVDSGSGWRSRLVGWDPAVKNHGYREQQSTCVDTVAGPQVEAPQDVPRSDRLTLNRPRLRLIV
jgi:hypothetical protein